MRGFDGEAQNREDLRIKTTVQEKGSPPFPEHLSFLTSSTSSRGIPKFFRRAARPSETLAGPPRMSAAFLAAYVAAVLAALLLLAAFLAAVLGFLSGCRFGWISGCLSDSLPGCPSCCRCSFEAARARFWVGISISLLLEIPLRWRTSSRPRRVFGRLMCAEDDRNAKHVGCLLVGRHY